MIGSTPSAKREGRALLLDGQVVTTDRIGPSGGCGSVRFHFHLRLDDGRATYFETHKRK